MIASPFIVIWIYAAIALSTDIIEFNPIIAAGIFIGIVALSSTCFAIMKICEEVSRAKAKDPDVSTSTAIKNVLTPECLKGNKIEMLS
ncbi:MAG: hypothetical protein sL5_10580 [Candidatus Mesenet longicola]|uniref:Uncharacterized protein n=1 Tax=Candidatus Mesenet longicola TaxID=1892558 RepID=A0A8J3MPM9_9RICK|nr:MAG: hypothetical protein sGL2_06730 [Candidatus Mesenet longicola]GHM60065.1 MAG: hypothetical protein sL5_10580 [Candidatus Mesenet longicola]